VEKKNGDIETIIEDVGGKYSWLAIRWERSDNKCNSEKGLENLVVMIVMLGCTKRLANVV